MSKQHKAWVVAADMGYGHQRTAYPLRDIAFGGKVINANSYNGIPKKDKNFGSKRGLYMNLFRDLKEFLFWGF